MAGVPPSTLQWLYDVLTQLNYREVNRTYSDLAQALGQYPSLGPQSHVYTSEHGTSTLLVKLAGTLPVNFRGTLYRFPLTIWVTQAYPYEAPLVYVTPTDDMVVRQGQHVSGADGKVYHHYLAGWVQAPDRSNLIELLQILADIFSREPPVMAKPQSRTQPRQPQGGPPVPPSPQTASRTGLHGSSIQHGGGPPPPPPPPKPPGTGTVQSGTIASPGPSKPSRYDAPPPLPPPASSQGSRPQSMHANGHVQPPGGMSYMSTRQEYQHPTQQYRMQSPAGPGSSPGPPYATQSPPPQLPPQQPRPSQHHQQYSGPSQNPAGPVHLSQQYTQQRPQSYHPLQQPPQPMAAQQQHLQQFRPQPQTQAHRQSSIPQPKQPAPQKDLLSEDDPFQLSLPTTQSNIPAPSIPPNPEKTALLSHLSHQILQHLHQSINQTSTTAIPSLLSQHVALQTAQSNLTAELDTLTTLSSHLQSNIHALTQTLNQANNTIASTKNPAHPSNPKNIPSIDEIIIPPSVIARQLYDNVSEQRGCESAIYALNEAFVKGRVGSELWSRKVRECAREEFRRKWMVKRIGVGLGLEGA